MSQGLTLLVLRIQEAWGYAGCQVVCTFHLLEREGFLHLQNNAGNEHQVLQSSYFKEELKQRIGGRVKAHPLESPRRSCLVTLPSMFHTTIYFISLFHMGYCGTITLF